MTKDLVALANRARWVTAIAALLAGAMLITGPTPARVLARSFGAFALPEGLAARIAALRALGRRRRRDDAPSTRVLGAPPLTKTAPIEEPALVADAAPVEKQACTPTAGGSQGEQQAPRENGQAPRENRQQAPRENGQAPPRQGSGLQAGAPVIGYVTAPPSGVGGGDLTPPERAIERACTRAGWRLVAIVRDREGGRILDRPGLTHALEQIAEGRAQGLVVNDARLLSRSLDFAGLVHWFRDAQAALIALDLGLDTSTPEGSRVASTLITLNGWAGERRIARRSPVGIANRDAQTRVPEEEVTLKRQAAG